MVGPYLIIAVIVGAYLVNSIKILNEYERGVIFRLGKLYPRPKGPGVILVFAPIDRIVRVSLRTIVMDVPPQDVITKDNVSVKVNAVVYFRVMDPLRSIVEVENFHYATSQLAQTTLRSVLGQVELDGLLSEREQLNQEWRPGVHAARLILHAVSHLEPLKVRKMTSFWFPLSPSSVLLST